MKNFCFPTLLLAVGLMTADGLAQATVTATTAATPQAAVGISARDGITVSGADVLVTRDGVTEKLRNELQLSNGLRVLPNGSVIARDGSTVTIRSTQILTFAGEFVDAPIRESVAPTTPPAATTNAAAPVVPAKEPAPTVTTQAAEDVARAEAARRASAAASQSPVKTEGGQK